MAQEHDLVDKGIIHIDSYDYEKVRYAHLEPLMLSAIYRYLEKEKGIRFADLIIEWMQQILQDLPVDKKELTTKEYQARSNKGFATEVLLADVLVMVSKELDGRSLTEHPLFSEWKDTFLKDYTLLAKGFQHDDGGLWKDVLQRKRTDILVLPPKTMRPDLFGLLKCIPSTPSHQKYGDHFIPITAGCKVNLTPLKAIYLDNYNSTNFWDIFTIDGQLNVICRCLTV